MGGIVVHNIASLLLLGFVSAFVSCGTAFAQMPAAADRWTDSWNGGDPERRYTTIAVEIDRRYDSSWTIHPQSPVSGIVTLHELKHHIPRRAEREFKRALAAESKGDRERAIMYFQKAIAIDPEFCAALNALGTTYLQTAQLDLAIEEFNKAIAVDPYGATPYSTLALVYLKKEQYDDAERAARRALELDRTSTHGHLTLGMSLVLQAKVTAEMERSLEKAASDYPCANFWLGIGLLNKGEIDNARARLKLYIARGEKVGGELARSLMQQLELMAQNSQ
jgi:tetratricopeptide (TPR) repeat protein